MESTSGLGVTNAQIYSDMLPCLMCGRRFETRESLEEHMNCTHGGPGPSHHRLLPAGFLSNVPSV